MSSPAVADAAAVSSSPSGSSSSAAPSPAAATALIIGGGIAGLTLALFLHRLGMPVRVFEAYGKKAEVTGGLQIAANGMNVLKALGLQAAMVDRGTICRTYRFCNAAGDILAEIPLMGQERYGADAVTCTRQAIHSVLHESLEAAGLKVEYSKRLASISQTADTVTATFEDGSQATGAFLVGADGIHSRTRNVLFPDIPQPQYLGYMGWGGIVRLSSLPAEALKFSRLEEGVMTITTGPVGIWGMAETTRDAEGNRYALGWSNSPQPPRAKDSPNMTPLQVRELLTPLYESWYAPVPHMLEAITDPVVSADRPVVGGSIYDLPDLTSWHSGRVVLVGDAAHASGPGGQGASMALEDAHYLARLIKDVVSTPASAASGDAAKAKAPFSSESLSSVFSAFQLHRKPRVDRIHDVARRRGLSKLQVVGSWGAWFRDRLTTLFMWWIRDSMGREDYEYKIPGYDTMEQSAQPTQ